MVFDFKAALALLDSGYSFGGIPHILDHHITPGGPRKKQPIGCFFIGSKVENCRAV